MEKILEYKIIWGKNCERVEEQVSDLILRFGWQPFGGIGADRDCYLYQVLVKYKQDK